MFPYYLLPKADDRQAPDKEQKRAYDPLSSIRVRQPKNKGKITDIVPLVVFTAFGIEEARELAQRLKQTIHPVDRPPHRTPAKDPPSPTGAPGSKKKQQSDKPKRNSKKEGGKRTDKVDKPPVVASEPSLSGFLQDIEWEPELTASELGNRSSGEDRFLSMNAVDMSYYLSAQHDNLVREVATALRHEKLFLFYLDDPLAFLKNFPEYGWDEESAEEAEKFIQWYVERFGAELEKQKEKDWWGGVESDLEYWIRDVANDERESVIVYDLEAVETLFVRYGDKDSVPLQEWQQKVAEGRNIVLIHNHPNNTAASLADLNAAAWLDAELMLVVNPDGTLHRYALEGDEMVALEPVHNPDYVAPSNPVETLAADVAYWAQSLMEIGNPAERVMRQGKLDDEENSINMDSRLVREFLLNPSTVVFLEDVANEYTVEDPQLHNAMVLTIIYRELSGQFGLENADNPRYQHNLDFLKRLLQAVPFVFKRPLVINDEEIVLVQQLDGDPSLGIGALSREAGINIQSDAERLGMTMYFPMLGFDRPTTLDHVPFSRGEHPVFQSFFVGSLVPEIRMLQAIPPTNQEEGAWRVELPRFESGAPAWLREQYEPTLGYIAAEVAIAMQTPQYQGLQTDEQRMAYLIAYHANRSAIPNETLYNLEKFSPDTDREIRWARDF